MRFKAVVTREGQWFVARCLEVEVASQGEAVESALANLREALEMKLEDEPGGSCLGDSRIESSRAG